MLDSPISSFLTSFSSSCGSGVISFGSIIDSGLVDIFYWFEKWFKFTQNQPESPQRRGHHRRWWFQTRARTMPKIGMAPQMRRLTCSTFPLLSRLFFFLLLLFLRQRTSWLPNKKNYIGQKLTQQTCSNCSTFLTGFLTEPAVTWSGPNNLYVKAALFRVLNL